MATSALRRGVMVVGGFGKGQGIGGASAAAFAKEGYKVALIARGADSVEEGTKDIIAHGGEAAPFPIKAWDEPSMRTVFESIKKHWPNEPIRVTLWNAGAGWFKGFLDHSAEDWAEVAESAFVAPAAFAKASILAFKENKDLTPEGARGTILFTGATSSWRGNKMTSAFSASKFALRSLSQSLNKEFGKENIHVAHAIIDGGVLTDRSREVRDEAWQKNEDVRIDPNELARTYVFLAHQHRSAWTWELDIRPAHETW